MGERPANPRLQAVDVESERRRERPAETAELLRCREEADVVEARPVVVVVVEKGGDEYLVAVAVREPRVRLERRVLWVGRDEPRPVQRLVLSEEGVGGEAVQRVVAVEPGRERVLVAGDEEVVGAVPVDDVRPFELLVDADAVDERREEFARGRVVTVGPGDTDGAVERLLFGVAAAGVGLLGNRRVPLEEDVRLARLGVLEVPRVAERVDQPPRLVLFFFSSRGRHTR